MFPGQGLHHIGDTVMIAWNQISMEEGCQISLHLSSISKILIILKSGKAMNREIHRQNLISTGNMQCFSLGVSIPMLKTNETCCDCMPELSRTSSLGSKTIKALLDRTTFDVWSQMTRISQESTPDLVCWINCVIRVSWRWLKSRELGIPLDLMFLNSWNDMHCSSTCRHPRHRLLQRLLSRRMQACLKRNGF